MICAIHQPNFFPWPGYFYKIYAADQFVFLDDVQFSKQSYTKRSKVKSLKEGEPAYINAAIKKVNFGTSINEIIAYPIKTLEHIKNEISKRYRSSPYYFEVYSMLEEWSNEALDSEPLASFNAGIIRRICEKLAFRTKFCFSSALNVQGKKSTRLVNICQSLDCTTYLTGIGSKLYVRKAQFLEFGIKYNSVDFFDYQLNFANHFTYHNPGYSILDLMLHSGFQQSAAYIKSCVVKTSG